MRNVSWAVYVAALLIGSSLAILSEAKVTEALLALDSCGCTDEACIKCVEDGCMLDPGESKTFVNWTTEDRCVDYDRDGIGHCAEFDVANYDITGADGYPNGNCKMIDCRAGVWSQVVCPNPWILPPPEEPLLTQDPETTQ